MQYIETGEIVSVHGIKGEVKIYPWADYPEFLEEFDAFYVLKNKSEYQKLVVQDARVHKNMLLAKFCDIDTIEIARNLIGKTVFVDKQEIELEQGYYFVSDLIDCKIIDSQSGECLGTVENVENFGASDIYTIKTEKGDRVLFPAVEEFLVSTDVDKKEIQIKVIEGMFSED